MSVGCCGASCTSQTTISPGFRKALWVALVINAVMFAVEIVGGLKSGSVLADEAFCACRGAHGKRGGTPRGLGEARKSA